MQLENFSALVAIVGEKAARRCALVAKSFDVTLGDVLRDAIDVLDPLTYSEAADLRRSELSTGLDVLLERVNEPRDQLVVAGDSLLYGTDLGLAEAVCFPPGTTCFVESDGPAHCVSGLRASRPLLCVRCGALLPDGSDVRLIGVDELPAPRESQMVEHGLVAMYCFVWIEIDGVRTGAAHPGCNGSSKETHAIHSSS